MPSKRSVARPDRHRTEDRLARRILGGERERSLESGSEPDCSRQAPVNVGQQPSSRGPQHCDGRHGVHHLGRQAILRLRSERSDVAAGDLNPLGGQRRQFGEAFLIRIGCRSSTLRHTRNTLPGTPTSTARLRPFSSATSETTTDIYPEDDRTTEPHLHQHRASTLGREQHQGLGRYALPEHRRNQRCRGRGNR